MNMSGESFFELVGKRQSVRAYLPSQVEPEKLNHCLEAARLAPSACNAQSWKFIVVDEPALKAEVAQATSSRLLGINHFTLQAPVLVVIVIERANFTSNMGQMIKDREFPLIDLGIATEHFCLQATAEGLGTCILGWFDEPKVKKLLSIPRQKRVGLIVTLGYAANQEIRPKKRKPIEEIISKNKY
jgi:nitroreductase